jgi:mannitol/fructose-specific phosphotransferase system IIA component (Ntr-type)
MKLSKNIKKDSIILSVNAEAKEEAITLLVDKLCDAHDMDASDREIILEAVLEREKVMSTGIGFGVGVPHGTSPSVEQILVSFGKSDSPILYSEMDHQKVDLFFLVVIPQGMVKGHLEILRKIAKLTNQKAFREDLRECESAEEVLETIDQAEREIEGHNF